MLPERADEHDRFMALAEHKLETQYERTERPLNDDEEQELAQLIETYGGRRRRSRRAGIELPLTRGAFYMVMRVLAEEFDLDNEPAAESFSRTTDFLKPAANLPGLSGLPENAECPCGTGLSVGECHRS